MVACVSFLCIPIISDKCVPALLSHRGPLAPQWRGHSDHLLSANCPAAPQDLREQATNRTSMLNLVKNPLGYIYGPCFTFLVQLKAALEDLPAQSITVSFVSVHETHSMREDQLGLICHFQMVYVVK